MNLSDTQVSEFHERGYLLLADVFGAAEVAALTTELDGIFAAIEVLPDDCLLALARECRTPA